MVDDIEESVVAVLLIFVRRAVSNNTEGKASKTKIVDEQSPPMTAMARGARSSTASPALMDGGQSQWTDQPMAMGKSPSTEVAVVMMMGRKRSRPALAMASRGGSP